MNLIIFCILGVVLPTICQKTPLDNSRNIKLYRAMKDMAFKVLGRTGDNTDTYNKAERELRRLQPQISKDVPFPCNVTGGRSKEIPKSVHKLRPGDIDIVGAMGDSLTAGSGIFATKFYHLVIENRGAAALGGGQQTWRECLTVPNIIKEFNPNLIGYSPYDSVTYKRDSGFNVAEVAAMSRDLPFMAENLIRRIKSHPRVDFEKSWKLINILIGPNDFCSDMCWIKSGPWSILENHKRDLIETLRFFKKNLPRSLISIVPAPNLFLLTELEGKSITCVIAGDIECSCLLGRARDVKRKEFSKIMTAWQRIDEEVAAYPEFQTEEFAVVVQPFTTNLTYPMKPDGSPDWRYLTTDCFHLSQLGNARASTALWKNMFEPVGQKSRNWNNNEVISCPTESHPYIATLLNGNGPPNS